MELTKTNRQSLLDRLEKAQEELDISNRSVMSFKKKDNPNMAEYSSMGCFRQRYWLRRAIID